MVRVFPEGVRLFEVQKFMVGGRDRDLVDLSEMIADLFSHTFESCVRFIRSLQMVRLVDIDKTVVTIRSVKICRNVCKRHKIEIRARDTTVNWIETLYSFSALSYLKGR